jgi:hypothetical protein
MSTILEPVSSSLASIATNPTGIITIEVDSPDRNAVISQEDNPANQSSIAPDTKLTASADGVRQTTRVYLITWVVCSTAAERGCCIQCSVGLFFLSLINNCGFSLKN